MNSKHYVCTENSWRFALSPKFSGIRIGGLTLNSKERVFAVLKGKMPDRIPVFPLLMMFSAARYGVDYSEYASNGHVLAEAQLKTRELFPLDAITSCSDAFRLSADLGGDIIFPQNTPPYLSRPLVRNRADLQGLKSPDIFKLKGRMYDRIIATSEMVRSAGKECMVLGWVDMPFAEACSVCGINEFMGMLHDDPCLAHDILRFLSSIVTEFALAQIETGAPMIGAGDAAASLVSTEMYREFALPYEKLIVDTVHEAGGMVKLHICGNSTRLLDDMASTGCDLFNIDHLVDLETAAIAFSNVNKAIKGNLNPVSDILQSTPENCMKKAKKCIERMQGYSYMLSPGCEVPVNTTDEVMMAFCNAVN
jgi:MtaA/CmuA family methyltransferase